MFFDSPNKEYVIQEMSPRLLANLGDAVFDLFERERQILLTKNPSKMHQKVQTRVNAVSQAALLDGIAEHLTEE